ncbi:MAG TPA: glutamate--tRNA ligase [Candidatus Dormibacteraeota bacterium]|nr:glutamate--tRNA ligase [Candidatus Dormibacteraeota bacterium]
MRTRFAPSPTGPLHFGSVRTALFAWLAARSSGGQFLLRIEDTDQERYLEDSEALIMETLLWLGLNWDEGPEVGGPHGPYIQSQRTPIYRRHADLLLEAGAAYWCTCTAERLAEMRERQRAAHQPTRYDRFCLNRQEEVARERAAGAPAVLRQLIPPGRTTWDDVIRGEISFDNADIDDQVLLKSDGFPTYHLAVVVDDHLMEISHVIRSDEWIPSTPKHLGLYSALEWTPPRFAHVPPVLGEDRQKLSKRHGARNVLEYGELGYLAPAIVNAMALLGWSSGTAEEVFTPTELVQRFSLDRVHDSAAVFDPKRLDSLNGQHIRRLPVEELVELLEFWLPGTSKETRRKLVPLLQERMVVMRDASVLAAPLLGDAPWDDDVVFPPRKVDADTAIELLDAASAEVEAGGLADVTAMRERLTALVEARGVKARDAFRVLYIAILGRAQGVPVFDAMAFIGPDVSVRRLRAARARLEL